MDFIQKQKKKEKSWSIKKTSRMCQCTRKTIGKTKKNHQFWVFSTSFNTISNVLNFLGVVFGVSNHSSTHILSRQSSLRYTHVWHSLLFHGSYLRCVCVLVHFFALSNSYLLRIFIFSTVVEGFIEMKIISLKFLRN